MDENPGTFQHSPSGDTGKPQGHSQQAPGVSGESQSCAGFDFHHDSHLLLKFYYAEVNGSG